MKGKVIQEKTGEENSIYYIFLELLKKKMQKHGLVSEQSNPCLATRPRLSATLSNVSLPRRPSVRCITAAGHQSAAQMKAVASCKPHAGAEDPQRTGLNPKRKP